MKNVIMIGPPGAGKGTQARRLAVALDAPHIASGDLLRDIRRVDTAVADRVKGYMERGEYVPDELMNTLVLDRLRQPDACTGFILDGFPRTEPQAEALDRAMAEDGRKLDRVLYMTAPSDVLIKRIEDRVICVQCHAIYNAVTRPPVRDRVCDVCGCSLERREDENPNVITTRLREFARQTEPLVTYYLSRRILCEVDGSRDLALVEAEIDAAVGLQRVS